jgi:hypothetical protein
LVRPVSLILFREKIFRIISNLDGLVKSLFGRHPGESRGPERFDSGFRRNDKKTNLSTFCEFINLRDRIFGESLAKVWKERQIPPQALAG